MYMEAASTARTEGGTRIRLALTILWAWASQKLWLEIKQVTV